MVKNKRVAQPMKIKEFVNCFRAHPDPENLAQAGYRITFIKKDKANLVKIEWKNQ